MQPTGTDLAVTAEQADKPPAVQSKHKPALTPRVRRAVELMVWNGLQYAQAATETGLTARAMRIALERPNTLAYLKQQQQILRSSEGPRNIHRLRQIRDAADNMPAVNAIKVLEQLDETQAQSTRSGMPAVPGLVIQVITPAPPQSAKVIEHEPTVE